MKRWTQAGLSLLEALVALAILGILMGGMMTMMRQENMLIQESAELLTARFQANETIETLKATPYEDVQSSSSIVVSEVKNMVVTVDVEKFEVDTLKKIVVTVKWTTDQGQERKFMLTTLRAKPRVPSLA